MSCPGCRERELAPEPGGFGRRYPGGMFALYPARLPPAGKPLELEAGAVVANDLLLRCRVRYSGDRRVQAVTLEEYRSPAQPGTR